MTRTARILAQLLLMPFLLAGPAAAQKSADTLRIAWRDVVPGLDPTITGRRSSQVLALQIFDTLIYRDPDTLQLKPLIAASWRQLDDKTMEFALRPGLRFSNGDELTADDVAYTVSLVLTHQEGEPVGGFTALAGIDVLDDLHIRLHFTQGVTLGMEYLAMLLPILPHAYRERVGANEFALFPVGSGPYRGHIADAAILLDRNELYPTDSPKTRPAIGHVIIRTVPDVSTQIARLLDGGADWIWDFDPDQVEVINALPNLQAIRGDSFRLAYLSLTPVPDTPFADGLVRQAIFHAINRVALARHFGSGSLRLLNAPCIPSQFGCEQSAAARYDYNPTLARQQLADAGYPNGFATTLISSLQPAWGGVLQADLHAVGIEVTLRQVQPYTAASLARGGQSPMLLGAWGSSAINDVTAILPHFFGGGPADHVRDPALIAILAASQTGDTDSRRQADAVAIGLITKAAYMLPLNILVDTFAFTRDLNFRLPPDDLPRFFQTSWK